MSKKFSFELSSAWLSALLFILFGVLMCIFRVNLLNWAMTVVGILLIVVGILQIIRKELTLGVILAAIGVVAILGGWLFLDIILLILGVALIAMGILLLIRAIRDHETSAIVSSSVTILVGALLFICKWAFVDWMFVVVGAFFIINGVLSAIMMALDSRP